MSGNQVRAACVGISVLLFVGAFRLRKRGNWWGDFGVSSRCDGINWFLSGWSGSVNCGSDDQAR